MKDSLIIDPKDNVEVVLSDEGGRKPGHKYALSDIEEGETVIKYGHPIGKATKNIKKGEWVHTHNLRSNLSEGQIYKYSPNIVRNAKPETKRYFQGFKRKDRKAGIRNHIYIIPTVGCINIVAKEIEKKAQKYVTGSIDGIFALTHQFGCSQLDSDADNIKNLLESVALNPNATKVLFIGLGCENNRLSEIKKDLDGYEHIRYYNCQEVDDEVQYGLEIIKSFAEEASSLNREKISLDELCIGLKCGGSDGFSGITANPLVGKISDKIISLGGSAVLTEVPEMFGAESILMSKCENEEIYEKFKSLIMSYRNFYETNGLPVYENPSPGNKEGGISTLEEKSLGCVRKAGSNTIVDVIKYADRVNKNGLTILDGPGNDLIASTALGAAGCQMVLFTTGRGTPFETFVPTIKISTNHGIAAKKRNWIDFDGSSIDEEGLFNLIIDVTSGNKKCLGEGDPEIAFFKKGVTL